MKDEEIITLIDSKISTLKDEFEAALESALKEALKGVKGSPADIEARISDGFEKLKASVGIAPERKAKLKPKPKYEPEFEVYIPGKNGSLETKVENTIYLMPTPENIDHEQGKEYTAKGPTALQHIRMGLATFVKEEKRK